jgi:hypothetical protein
MPRIRLILEDDNGNLLPENAEQVYSLDGDCDTLNEIEAAVEKFKKQALPQVEQTLLTQAQQRFVSAGEKSHSDPKRQTRPPGQDLTR